MDYKKLFQFFTQLRDSIMGTSGFVRISTDATTSGTLGYDTKSAGFLLYDNLAGGPYTVGETVTGGTSTATGVVVEDTGSRLVMNTVVGTFQNNETLTGGTSGATSDADGVVTFYNFEAGDVITGVTSSATATVASVEDGELLLTGISGTFQNNEKIKSAVGDTTRAEALADGTVSFSYVGDYNLIKANGAANLVLERVIQQNGITVETITILAGGELKGSFKNIAVTSGIGFAYNK